MIARKLTLLGLAALFWWGCDSGGSHNVDAGADAAPECSDPAECDDGIDCTVDSCVDNECRNTPDDLACADDDWCNGDERCSVYAGCEAGQPQVCDDGINCTVDTCAPDLRRCLREPDDDLCEAGYVCDVLADGCVPE